MCSNFSSALEEKKKLIYTVCSLNHALLVFWCSIVKHLNIFYTWSSCVFAIFHHPSPMYVPTSILIAHVKCTCACSGNRDEYSIGTSIVKPFSHNSIFFQITHKTRQLLPFHFKALNLGSGNFTVKTSDLKRNP